MTMKAAKSSVQGKEYMQRLETFMWQEFSVMKLRWQLLADIWNH